jgi:hypothetical protein
MDFIQTCQKFGCSSTKGPGGTARNAIDGVFWIRVRQPFPFGSAEALQ